MDTDSEGTYYSKKEFSVLIWLQAVFLLIYIPLSGLWGFSSNSSLVGYAWIAGPLILIISITTVILQQRRNPQFGFLLIINFILILFVLFVHFIIVGGGDIWVILGSGDLWSAILLDSPILFILVLQIILFVKMLRH